MNDETILANLRRQQRAQTIGGMLREIRHLKRKLRELERTLQALRQFGSGGSPGGYRRLAEPDGIDGPEPPLTEEEERSVQTLLDSDEWSERAFEKADRVWGEYGRRKLAKTKGRKNDD